MTEAYLPDWARVGAKVAVYLPPGPRGQVGIIDRITATQIVVTVADEPESPIRFRRAPRLHAVGHRPDYLGSYHGPRLMPADTLLRDVTDDAARQVQKALNRYQENRADPACAPVHEFAMALSALARATHAALARVEDSLR